MKLNFNQKVMLKAMKMHSMLGNGKVLTQPDKTLIDAMASCECFSFAVHLAIYLLVGGGNPINSCSKNMILAFYERSFPSRHLPAQS